MKAALCVIATGKYTRFLPGLLDSAAKFWFFDQDAEVFLFVDAKETPLGAYHPRPSSPTGRRLVKRWHDAIHEPWPGPTLHRYRTMLQAEKALAEFDHIFYCDADMLFVAPVGTEICGPGLTATIHPGFAGKPRHTFTYENRPASRACVRPNEGTEYFAGGFQGGAAAPWLEAMSKMAANIDIDTAYGITAVWQDESHWNRHLIDNPPRVTLPPLYCSPESWNAPGRKLVALDKNHREVRS